MNSPGRNQPRLDADRPDGPRGGERQHAAAGAVGNAEEDENPVQACDAADAYPPVAGRSASEIDTVADIFKALGQPVRLRVMVRLMLGAATPGELATRAGVEGSLLSRHLRHLQAARLIRRYRVDGRMVVGLGDGVADVIGVALAYHRTMRR